MMKLKMVGMLSLASLFTIFPARSDDSETQNSSSIFWLFSSDTPLQEALKQFENHSLDVISFYQEMKNVPVWFAQGQLTKIGKIAIDVLKNAKQEGLNPHEYEDATQIPDHPENWVDSEILLTKRFLDFIGHVRAGRIDAMTISPDIKFHSPKAHAVELLVDALLDKKTEGNKLRLMAPHLPQYAELKRILADYRERFDEMKEWPTLTSLKTLRLEDVDPDVAILRQILVLHGDLPKDQEFGEKFDAGVAAALCQFQKCYSLDPDGAVGPKTKEALNYPIKDRIQRVIVNMERLRWLPDDLGHKHIIVNVAGYVLHGFEDGEVKIMMPVIVGRPDRRTPLFYATLRNIVLNPSWGVPHSIFMNDKLPKIRNDPGYVRRANFTIMDRNGRVIDPDAADWANEGKRYYLRQSPGRHNALGQIKFNIENPYTIYMHGTPQQNLFSRKARAFSSGCIRLKYPLKLAAWVLNNDTQWPSENIQAAINKGTTQTVKPAEYVPVYFTYQTIWVKETEKGNRIFFSDDPYKLDMKMAKILHLKDLKGVKY